MARVLVYKNNSVMCFCTIQLDDGDKIFISIANTPSPKVGVYKSRMMGFLNTAIWEFTPEMAGGYDAYTRKLARAFYDYFDAGDQPLDTVKNMVLSCTSTAEVQNKLFEAERRMETPMPGESISTN